MAWYFLCDRTDVLAAGPKAYSRDLFIFLFVVLTSVAAGSSLQQVKQPLLLNRPQTEEWKGWMQVRGRGRQGCRYGWRACMQACVGNGPGPNVAHEQGVQLAMGVRVSQARCTGCAPPARAGPVPAVPLL